jgi:dolichol-phosphate mannosyltransferase
MKLSVVIPVMNERENIKPLVEKLNEALKDIEYEVIFVDDGSTDGTPKEILKLKPSNIRLIVFSRNFGQTSALDAGIHAANGEFIVTLDGDLQNDPSDIPNMLKKLEDEDLDLVAGIRANRNDGFILRKIPSKIANYLIRKSSQVEITDTGCTLKVFRSALAKKLDLYGELHRFIPILANIHGAKIAEMPVKHHARKFGVSKYGIGRTIKVLSDLMLLLLFQKYKQKPMHLFGSLGLSLFGIGSLISLYMLFEKFMGNDIGHRPLFFIGIFCVITSFQFITAGFIAELMVRTYYGSQKTKPYNISKEYEAGKLV